MNYIAKVTTCTAAAMLACASASYADTRFQIDARVIGVEPRYQTVRTDEPVEVCDRVSGYQDNSGIGTVVGGVAGGVIGHELAGKGNRTEGTIIGGVVGAIVGNQVGQNNSGYRTTERCHVEYTRSKKRVVVGYLVTAKVAGRAVTLPMDHDPGSTVRLSINVSPAE